MEANVKKTQWNIDSSDLVLLRLALKFLLRRRKSLVKLYGESVYMRLAQISMSLADAHKNGTGHVELEPEQD